MARFVCILNFAIAGGFAVFSIASNHVPLGMLPNLALGIYFLWHVIREEAQEAEANLAAILEKLEEIRCCIIDVENAIE